MDKVQQILECVVVNNDSENLIAHYTTATVSYLMLNHDQRKYDDLAESERPSYLRLNPIHFMNDPTEGLLISKLFNLDFKWKEDQKYLEHSKAFIGCFTLHQDSLNQFRLYGKENGKEASGVSLILEREKLFSNKSNFSFINKPIEFKISLLNEATDASKKKNELIEQYDFKLPLYLCIYYDPESGLIHLAHREEWTFCRQEQNAESAQWVNYKKEIDDITKKVRDLIGEVNTSLETLMNVLNEKSVEFYEILDEILLPLRYLIKHYAFKEEQECRAIYISTLDDKRVKLDRNLKRIYVDYVNILPMIKKIYLPSGALQHESALQYLGQTSLYGKFEVKRSHNPFR